MRIPVEEGIQNKNMQEVFGEVKATDKLLKKGSEELEDGTQVNIKKNLKN